MTENQPEPVYALNDRVRIRPERRSYYCAPWADDVLAYGWPSGAWVLVRDADEATRRVLARDLVPASRQIDLMSKIHARLGMDGGDQ